MSYGSAKFTDSVTINNPALTGTAGVARFTIHLSGTMTESSNGSAGAAAQYSVYFESNYSAPINYSGGVNTQGDFGTPYPSLSTFTYDVLFYYGSPVDVTGQLSNSIDAQNSQNGGSTADTHLTLSLGNYVVVDNQNNPVDYSATSNTGSARSSNIPAGGGFAGYSLTNTAPGRVGTSLNLLGGSASTAETVRAAFIAPPDPSQVQLTSDALDVTGTGSDIVVVQLDYDPALAQLLFGSEAALRLAWLNSATGQWINAIFGNAGGAPHFFGRAYNPATDFQLGNFGLDAANHVVWAVINHNSEFGVSAVADPLIVITAVSRKTHGVAG
ncbi:MAG: hypothetical protein ABJB22_04900, partial [Verrucomicrobiota bacterium]